MKKWVKWSTFATLLAGTAAVLKSKLAQRNLTNVKSSIIDTKQLINRLIEQVNDLKGSAKTFKTSINNLNFNNLLADTRQFNHGLQQPLDQIKNDEKRMKHQSIH